MTTSTDFVLDAAPAPYGVQRQRRRFGFARWLAALASCALVLAAAASAQEAPAAPARGRAEAATSRPATAAATQPATAPASRPAAGPAEPDRPRGPLAGLAYAVGKLYWYFGLVGVASIAVWLATWLAAIVFAFRTRGMPACLGTAFLIALAVVYVLTMPEVGEFVAFFLWLAIFPILAVVVLWALHAREIPVAFGLLILALVSFGLGIWNADNVALIEEDRTAELAAARERQRRARQREQAKLKGRAADIHFAEDDAEDALDLAGYKKKDLKALGRGGDANAPDDANQGGYAYRAAGKKARDANQVGKGDLLTRAADPEDTQATFGRGARMLPGRDYVLALQLDRINRFAVRLTLVLALVLAAIEYLRRFNRTFGSIFPLPIAGRAIEAIWPKTHTVYLHVRDGRAVRRYLETAAQKGESFLCISSRDPWPAGTDRLARLPLKGLWPLRKIACPPGDAAYDSRFIFESAWYGRYGFVLLADGLDGPLREFLADLLAWLRMRRHTRATARRSINLLWDLPDDLPGDVLEELAFLCRETNLKLLVASPRGATEEAAGLFEETCVC